MKSRIFCQLHQGVQDDIRTLLHKRPLGHRQQELGRNGMQQQRSNDFTRKIHLVPLQGLNLGL